MGSALQIAVRNIHLGLLWGASLFVPTWRRSEWSQEWRAELWYVLRECSCESSARRRPIREATAFCLGAYQDAICLRKGSWRVHPPLAKLHGSAAVSLFLLLGIFLAAWGLARTSTRVRAGMSRIQVHPWRMSTTPCDCASDLKFGRGSLQYTHLLFDGFSHYKVARVAAWSEDMPRTEWTVAQAGSDFFEGVHLPVRITRAVTGVRDRLPQVVLTHDSWIRDFGGRPNVRGTELHVGSVDAIVAGVDLGGSMGLPGSANAWLLGSDRQVGASESAFLVGHLSPFGYLEDGRWGLSAGGILLAFLILPFVTRLSIGEYDSGSQMPSLTRRMWVWAFLFSKIIILLAIVYYISLDLGCLLAQPFSPSSQYIQTTSSIALSLLGLRWAFRDQQRRCPVCLKRMSLPVEVGQPSRTFLTWNGTELVCGRGHTLLHIPESPTSWFSSQRWVCLDKSWQFLFAQPNS
jgi:hypothetical protein